jgi:hypothetical protein
MKMSGPPAHDSLSMRWASAFRLSIQACEES